MNYIVFFKTTAEKNTRTFYAREFKDINKALECRENLIKQKEYNGHELIYTSIKEGII